MTLLVDWKFWSTFAYPIYAITIVLLVLVIFTGTTVKGATSWFSFLGFSLQPAELAKFGTCLALAAYLSYYKTSLKNLKNQLTSIGLFDLPMMLILLQPDAGSALVFTSFMILLFREGLSPWLYISGGVIIALFIFSLIFQPVQVLAFLLLLASVILASNLQKKIYWFSGLGLLLIFSIVGIRFGFTPFVVGINVLCLIIIAAKNYLNRFQRQVAILFPVLLICVGFSFFSNYGFENLLEPHQQDRINVWLRPDQCDPRGSLYNVLQSKIAIGSGGMEGKGFLKGTMTNLNFVPEQTTDFIFSTIGEEQGFIGSLGIIVLFSLLILRAITISERARSSFVRHYGYGVAGILFFHFFINIGMTMGLVPIIGIPLPFISYGGSSLLGFSLMLGILLKMDSSRFE
jgi:rod shape determining protein RodA